MKELWSKHKKLIIGVFVIIGFALLAGISYAYIRFVAEQSDENVVGTLCLNLKLDEVAGSGIHLQDAYPISEAEGQRLTPYTFTITNTCKNATQYQVNLDILTDLTNSDSLGLEYIRSSINGEESKLLSSYPTTEKTKEEATTSKLITTGTLVKGESVNYEIRLWMDENTTAEEGASKLFRSKIIVTASTALPNEPLSEYGIYETIVASGEGLYEVSHEEAEITYTSNENAINNLKQPEYRYAGKNPNNYVTFNGETAGWRIIGLVNTPEGQRIKLVRANSIGDYSWDSSASSVNSGYGINEWSQADIMTLLNHGAYYNRTTGTCYNGQNNSTTPCDFSSNGLTNEAKGMIDTITWNTGSNGSASNTTWQTANMYNYERSNNTGKDLCSSGIYCNDTVTRTTSWQGQIGLMYPSDYGYATVGGSTTNRNTCMSTSLFSWNESNYSDCKGNDWILNGSTTWLLTPNSSSSFADFMFALRDTGQMRDTTVFHARVVLPTLYLKTNIKAVSGDGTSENPYVLEDKSYKESVLHGTDPVLSNGLIPVVIENDGTVKKADITSEWYNYGNQRWANAVILEDESVSYQNNEVIPEENIESYFVWIPRYKYKIFNDGNYSGLTSIEKKEQTIDVIFETKDVEASNGSAVGEYLTHPAFTAFDVNGLWVGKFETGYKGATSTGGAESNTYDANKVEIKPNVYSWRSIQVVNAHKNSYNYKREYDSHMMKNTEWGAVAYLQHSNYGSRASVRMNNNSAYITGYGAVAEPTCGYTGANEDCNKQESTGLNADGTYTKRYNTDEGHAASTTGNITGVYDMSGGSWEYVMGVMTYGNGTLCAGRNSSFTSGFAGIYCENGGSVVGEAFPAEKYYDKYAYSTSHVAFQRGILGDATKEMGPFANATYGNQTRQIESWYGDEAWFVFSSGPWFLRGEGYFIGTGAGVFAFGVASNGGGASLDSGFRIVLAF